MLKPQRSFLYSFPKPIFTTQIFFSKKIKTRKVPGGLDSPLGTEFDALSRKCPNNKIRKTSGRKNDKTYPTTADERCAAVNRRAAALPNDYLTKARRLDNYAERWKARRAQWNAD